MLYLLHGDHVEASRAELQRLKNAAANREVRQLDGSTLDPTLLTQALSSGSLFTNQILVIVENLFTKLGKKEKLIKQLTSLLKETTSVDIILWEEKEITKTQLAALGPNVKVGLFKIPRVIFSFLDNLRPGNCQRLLELYAQVLVTEAPEVVLAMIARRLRLLLQLVDGVKPNDLADWQLARLTAQSRFFTMEKLQTMYQKLVEIEFSLKTGNSAFTLSQHIEQLILNL